MSEEATLKINVEHVDGAVVIEPHGEVDMACSPILRVQLQQALRASPSRIVVDLGKTPYVDSSGVATLIEGLQHAQVHGVPMALCNPVEEVKAMLEIVRLGAVFTIATDRASAMTVGA